MDKKKLIEKVPVPREAIRMQVIVLLPVFLNVFMMGCTGSWGAYAIYFFTKGDEVSATMDECSQMVSLSEIGRILCAIPGGILADKLGRKKINITTGILHFTAWIILSSSTSIMAIYIARLMLGIGTALVNATATISIGEIASPQIRGSLIGIYLIFFYSGAIFQGVNCAIFASYHILTYSNTAFSMLYFVFMYWAMETPNFLLSVSKHEQAMTNLQRIRPGYSEEAISIEYNKMNDYITVERKQKEELNWSKFLRSKAIRVPLLTTLYLNFLTIMTGINLVGSYTTLIIPNNDYVPKKFYPLIMQTLLFIPTMLTPFYMDKFDRRTLFLFGSALTCIIQTTNGFTYYFYSNYDVSLCKWAFVAGNLMLNAAYGSTLGPTNSAIKSELFPQAVKGLGGALSIISQATATILGYKLYHYMCQNYLHLIYFIFALNAVVLGIVVHIRLPEGRGKLLSDLQAPQQVKKPTEEEIEKKKIEQY